jgi:hypothetical protein
MPDTLVLPYGALSIVVACIALAHLDTSPKKALTSFTADRSVVFAYTRRVVSAHLTNSRLDGGKSRIWSRAPTTTSPIDGGIHDKRAGIDACVCRYRDVEVGHAKVPTVESRASI